MPFSASSPNPLRYATRLLLPLLGCLPLAAAPVINEFMAANGSAHPDDDGDYSDWIELYNPDAAPVDLTNWSLTDASGNPGKWKFPAVTLPADGYLLVYASDKNRTDPLAPLHANFKLSADGEYLALVQPDGTTVASALAPSFPAQYENVSYGWTQPAAAAESPALVYFSRPTPGARNGDAASLAIQETVVFSAPSGPFASGISLQLSGASSGQVIRYLATAPSVDGGADVPAPTADAPAYGGAIAITESVIVRAAVFSADGARSGPVATAHFLRVDQGLGFAGSLPVAVLDNHGLGDLVPGESKKPAWFHLFTPGESGEVDLRSAPALSAPANARIRGTTSAQFPKKSFNLELLSNLRKKQARPLLGLAADVDWALVSPWNYDRANLRSAYLYTLSRQIGRWAPHTRFVELFFNTDGGDLDSGDYRGISVLTERIQIAPHRVAIDALERTDTSAPAVTGGYLLKIDSADADEFSWRTSRNLPPSTFGSAIVLANPKLDDLANAQRDYITGYIQDMEDALHADRDSGWAMRRHLDFIDRDSWVDYHILINLAKSADGMQRSSYFYKGRGQRLTAGPLWDLDRSMHSYDGGQRDADWSTWTNIEGDTLWTFGWWGLLTRDPDYRQAWVDRWQTLRLTTLADAHLIGLADELAAQIGPEAFARDAALWGFNSSFTDEMQRLTRWLSRRANWIDSQCVAVPTTRSVGHLWQVTPPAGAAVVYTEDGTDPRLSGGALSPSARRVDGPVVLTPSASLRFRSFNASLRDAYPGSPWSRLVTLSSSPDGEPVDPIDLGSRTINARRGASVTLSPQIFVAGDLTVEWQRNSVTLPDATELSLTLSHLSPAASGTYRVHVFRDGAFIGWAEFVITVSSEPIVDDRSAQPVTALSDATVTFDPDLQLASSATYEWSLDSEIIPDATAAELVLTGVRPAHSGRYVLRAYENGVLVATVTFRLEVSTAADLVNLSARAGIGANGDVLIGGFVTGGTGLKSYLIRAIGPTLSDFGIDAPLTAPSLRLYNLDGSLRAANTNWTTADNAAAVAAAAIRVGAFALTPGRQDSALLVQVPAGIYTLHTSNTDGRAGVGLAEIYALDADSAPLNLSARAQVHPGERLLIGGFVIAGETSKRVLVRAVGPGLAQHQVPSPLADPELQLHVSGAPYRTNDDWSDQPDADAVAHAARTVGAFPLAPGSTDSALLLNLAPGVYTISVRGKGETSGTALVEIYAVD